MKSDSLATVASRAANDFLERVSTVMRRDVSWVNSRTNEGVMFVSMRYRKRSYSPIMLEVFFRRRSEDDCAFLGMNIVDAKSMCLDENALVYKTQMGSHRKLQIDGDFVHAVIALSRELEEPWPSAIGEEY